MADELTIKILAAIEEAKQGIAAIGEQVNKLGATVEKSATQHEQAAKKSKEHGDMLHALGEHAKEAEEHSHKLIETLERLVSMATGGPQGGLLMSMLGGSTMLFGLVEITKSTTEWDTAVAHLSHELNNNAQEASLWAGIAAEAHLPVDDLIKGIRTLSEHVDLGSKALHDMGVATVDASGKLLPMADILMNTRQWFQEHEGSTLAAARATELFGRSGMELLPIMSLNDQQFGALVKDVKDLGLVMDNEGLMRSRAYEAELQHLGLVLRALEIQVGEPLIHAFAVGGQAIANAIIPHLAEIRAALENVVSFVLGVIHALTGATFQLSQAAQASAEVADQVGQAGDATDTLGSNTNSAADAARALRDATREQVQAIQDQIKAIQEADRELEQWTSDQIKALQQASQQENYAYQQQQIEQRKADKVAEIQRLQNEYEIDLREGNLDHAQQVYLQLSRAKEEELQIEQDIQRQADDRSRQLREEDLRSNLDAVKRQHQTEVDALQDRQRAIEEAAQRAEEAMQSAATGMSDAVVGAGGAMASSMQDTMDKVKVNISEAGSEAGNNFGKGIKDAFGALSKFFQESEAERDAQMSRWGDLAGQAFGSGMAKGFWKALDDSFSWNPGSDLGLAYRDWLLHHSPGAEQQKREDAGNFQSGGIIPGSYSMPQPIIAHGSEMVLNPSQQATLFSLATGAAPAGRDDSGGGRSVTMHNEFHIHDATDPVAVGQEVRRALTDLMGVM